jgi:hypothetical protein
MRESKDVPQDYVLAHMWFNLAAAQVPVAVFRDDIASKMSAAQIAEAQKLAREWKPKSNEPRPSRRARAAFPHC